MRIDTSFVNLAAVANDKVNRHSTHAPGSGKNEGVDEAKLSSGDSTISGLSTRAMSEPEIRSERVESLRAAIVQGTYASNPQATADAMFNELF
jgi:flagellar biosynthesis anti-sigma factor FlgM